MPVRSPHDPVLVAACRTAVGTAGHALAGLTVTDLAAPVLSEVARLASPLGVPVTEVVLGNCLGPGGNVGRVAALAAGLGTDVPAVTVDRQCGSGLEAVRVAAALVRAAATLPASPPPLVLAGGAESASTAPWRFWPPRPDGGADKDTPVDAIDDVDGSPRRYERAPFAPPGYPDPEMGPAADRLARERGISRDRQDRYAARSHARALAAIAGPDYVRWVIPIGDIRADERPRAITAERLARLRPAFGAGHDQTADRPPATVTAGNSSGISDGAAAVAITTAAAAQAAGMPAVRIVAAAVAAGDPALPGAGAGPAAALALRQAGAHVDDLAVIEVVEAFAAVALAFADDLGVDEDRLCADGGAIAIGHPWGASGAIALAHVTHRLLRAAPGQLGLAACAIGGGQGIAVVVQRCEEPGR